MRLRVAVMATLLNLLVFVLLLVSFVVSSRNVQNDLIREELRVTCRLSKETLDSAAFMDREDYLTVLSEREDIAGLLTAYIAEDGTVVYKDFPFDIQEDHLRMLIKNTTASEVLVAGLTGYQNASRIFAACRLDDGSIITYAKNAASVSAIAGKGAVVLTPVLIATLLLQFFIIYNHVGRYDRLVHELMNVLEDFTEGRFSSRITNVKGFSPKYTAQYNQTLARVQDRVFRQVRRNRVVGQMLNQMHTGIVTADTNLTITFITTNAGKLFGRDIKDAEGRSLREVFDNEELEKQVTEAIESGSSSVLTAETEGRTESGAVRPIRLYTSTMSSAGKTTGALVVIEDITEIHKLEQIRTDFAANVSHEMKTPLTSIKGFIETLQAGAVDNPQTARRFLDIMMMEAERLTRLINDILSITKLESGTDSVEIKRLNLMDIIGMVQRVLTPQAENKQVEIVVNNSAIPAWIMGNRDRVHQLVLNLVENGIKYNKIGGTVTVTVTQDQANIYMLVADTGIGIKEENLSRLFERFYRVDKGRSREMGGTGLGLAICKHIVNTMDGYIEVHSKYGEGTEFLVTLPKAPEEERDDALLNAEDET
ncbi:MAG: PAS domain S-box protein [Clostridia bacterium]|nr:PAS domain S-box protein [Clostridia bacterium]